MPTADEVASVILERQGGWTDAKKLQKLLYYVQSWHAAITDEPLFHESFKAWAEGPVVPQVWYARKDESTRRGRSQNTSGVRLDELSSGILDMVLDKYGHMTSDELSALTHSEDPWREARGGLAEGAHSDKPLNIQTMATFYRINQTLGGHTAS